MSDHQTLLGPSPSAPGPKPPRAPRTSIFVVGAVTALFLLLAGGLVLPRTAPEDLQVASSGSTAAAASAKAGPTASATPTPSSVPTAKDAAAPLDPETPSLLAEGVSVTAPKAQPAFATTAKDLLATLPIKGRAPKTGYSRALFGQAWLDVDRNGCDTRNDMLKRDLTAIVFANSVPCKVSSGVLADPYTGTSINFVRGSATSSAVQIDHVVALSDAWQKGAQQLSTEQRTAFANDPLNLQSTDGPTNMKKGDGDAATWLPPNKGFRCEYVARQISVKATYSLWLLLPLPLLWLLLPLLWHRRRHRPLLPTSPTAPQREPPARRRFTRGRPATVPGWTATPTASPAKASSIHHSSVTNFQGGKMKTSPITPARRQRRWQPSMFTLVVLTGLVLTGCGAKQAATEPAAAVAALEMVTVPGVVSLTLDKATDELEDLGFEVEAVDSADGKSILKKSNWQVMSQEAAEGASVAKGSIVHLEVTSLEKLAAEKAAAEKAAAEKAAADKAAADKAAAELAAAAKAAADKAAADQAAAAQAAAEQAARDEAARQAAQAPAPAPAPAAVAPAPAPAAAYYANCTAARAAGAAPIYAGQPGYGTHLDRDRDGIGCDK